MAEVDTASSTHGSTSATGGEDEQGADQQGSNREERAKTVRASGIEESKQQPQQRDEPPSSRTMYLVRNMLGHLTTQAYALRDSHLQVSICLVGGEMYARLSIYS